MDHQGKKATHTHTSLQKPASNSDGEVEVRPSGEKAPDASAAGSNRTAGPPPGRRGRGGAAGAPRPESRAAGPRGSAPGARPRGAETMPFLEARAARSAPTCKPTRRFTPGTCGVSSGMSAATSSSFAGPRSGPDAGQQRKTKPVQPGSFGTSCGEVPARTTAGGFFIPLTRV